MSESKKLSFCSQCGTRFLPAAAYCHSCGSPVSGSVAASSATSSRLKWGLPAAAILALVVMTVFNMGTTDAAPNAAATTIPLTPPGAAAPDISALSPTERADRLFNRVMRLWSEGKTDSATFFAPMALSAFEGIAPLTAHVRYDLGLVALVAGDIPRAAAQSDTILAQRQNHLLGLALAARVADARGDVAAGRNVRQKLVAADSSERASRLPEYIEHEADLRAAVEAARSR